MEGRARQGSANKLPFRAKEVAKGVRGGGGDMLRIQHNTIQFSNMTHISTHVASGSTWNALKTVFVSAGTISVVPCRAEFHMAARCCAALPSAGGK
eukprot:15354422-Ditylum_brightwellii.AAC.1